MLTLHLLGHVHVSHNQRTVPISAKAAALITYLTIEKLPQHRERLADLLWDTVESRKNLRVELARIRSAGLDVFPSSSQLLHLEHVTSDFDLWCEESRRDMNQRQLTGWLATLRGLPFTGLEDLGSPTFQAWIDQQRWLMIGQVEQHLRRVYWRHAREGHTWATRLIAERAEALGLDDPAQELDTAAPALPSPEPSLSAAPAPLPVRAPEVVRDAKVPRAGSVHFERPAEERELLHVFRQAEEQPQVVYLHGPIGSGKSYLVGRLAAQLDWVTVPVVCARPGRLVVAGLAQSLLRLCDAQDAQALSHLLLNPASLEEDMVKVAYLLSRVRRPVLLVFDQTQDANPELQPLLEFLIESCGEGGRVFLVLGREPSARVPMVQALLRRVERSRRLELSLDLLSVTSVQHMLEAQFPFEPSQRLWAAAARLMQRSEGHPPHLLSLLAGAPDLESAHETAFPDDVLDALSAEASRWPAPLHEALSRLSVTCGAFDLTLACAVLGEGPETTGKLLHEALERHILQEADAEGPLSWPLGTVDAHRTQVENGYLFQSEGLRVALARRLPQFLRQEVRRRLAEALEGTSPGLAAYYARRAGLPEEAARLQGLYRQHLPPDSPLRQLPGKRPAAAHPERSPAVLLTPEVSSPPPGPPDVALVRQGYRLSSDRGWLNVLSSARYGPASTLTLHLPVPSAAPGKPAELRLLWRLDLYRGGEELGPNVPPFALRVGVLDAQVAHVLTPGGQRPYHEDGVRHLPHPEVSLGTWMEHRLHLETDETRSPTLTLSVRAVDLALTLAAVRWNGQDLLRAAPAPHPRSLMEG